MEKKNFKIEVEKRLLAIFKASKDGYKLSPVARHRLEGFIEAGIFMGLTTKQEMADLMDNISIKIFGKSIRDQQSELTPAWQEETIDYSQYDQPAYERKNSD